MAYETGKDLVTRLDVDFTTSVVHCSGNLRLAEACERAVDTDTLQDVATQLLLRLLGVLLSQLVNLREIFLALRRQVVIDDASELQEVSVDSSIVIPEKYLPPEPGWEPWQQPQAGSEPR